MLGCIRATYQVIDFIIDTSNAFQATRTDDGSLKTKKLYCDQPPGFEERGNGREPEGTVYGVFSADFSLHPSIRLQVPRKYRGQNCY